MIWILRSFLEEAAGKKAGGKEKTAPVVLRPELGGFGGAGAGSGTAGPGGSHPAHSGGQAGPGSLERDSDRPGAHLRRPEPGAAGHGQPAPGGPGPPLPIPGIPPRRSWPGSVRLWPGTWPSSWSRPSWRATMSRSWSATSSARTRTARRRKTRRPWPPPPGPGGRFQPLRGPVRPHPGADPAAGGPLCGPAGILGGTAAGWDVEAMFRGRVGITGSLASPNL